MLRNELQTGAVEYLREVDMKKETVKLIENKFKKDFEELFWKIRKNKDKIKDLAKEQRELKDLRCALFEILSQIRGYK